MVSVLEDCNSFYHYKQALFQKQSFIISGSPKGTKCCREMGLFITIWGRSGNSFTRNTLDGTCRIPNLWWWNQIWGLVPSCSSLPPPSSFLAPSLRLPFLSLWARSLAVGTGIGMMAQGALRPQVLTSSPFLLSILLGALWPQEDCSICRFHPVSKTRKARIKRRAVPAEAVLP